MREFHWELNWVHKMEYLMVHLLVLYWGDHLELVREYLMVGHSE